MSVLCNSQKKKQTGMSIWQLKSLLSPVKLVFMFSSLHSAVVNHQKNGILISVLYLPGVCISAEFIMCSYVVLTTRLVLHGNKMDVALLAPDVTGGPPRARWSSIFVPHKLLVLIHHMEKEKHHHGLWASDARSPLAVYTTLAQSFDDCQMVLIKRQIIRQG